MTSTQTSTMQQDTMVARRLSTAALTDARLAELIRAAESYPFVCEGWQVDTEHTITSIRSPQNPYYPLRSNLSWAARTLTGRTPSWARALTKPGLLPRLRDAFTWLTHTEPDTPDATVSQKIIAYWHEDADFIATFDPPTVQALLNEVSEGRRAGAELEALTTALSTRRREMIAPDGLRHEVIDLTDLPTNRVGDPSPF